MKSRFRFQKNSEYDKQPSHDEQGNWIKDRVPMYKGILDIGGKVYDGRIFRDTYYGKEVLTICLESNEDQSPF